MTQTEYNSFVKDHDEDLRYSTVKALAEDLGLNYHLAIAWAE